MDDFVKNLFDNAGVKVVESPEALFDLLGDPQPEATQAINLTSKDAVALAAAALFGASAEFAKSHLDCAMFKQDSAAVWLAIAELLERQEKRARKASAE